MSESTPTPTDPTPDPDTVPASPPPGLVPATRERTIKEIAALIQKNFGDIFEVASVDGEIVVTAIPKNLCIRGTVGGFSAYSDEEFEQTLVQMCAGYARMLDRAMSSASARLDVSTLAGGPAEFFDETCPLCNGTREVSFKSTEFATGIKACPTCRPGESWLYVKAPGEVK